MVIVGGCGKARSGEVQADSMYVGEGIREDPQPSVVLKCGESCVYRHEFCSHDGVAFIASCCVYEDSGSRWYMYHGCPQSRVSFDVGSVCVYPCLWDEFWVPGNRGGWGRLPCSVEVAWGTPCGECRCPLQVGERLGERVGGRPWDCLGISRLGVLLAHVGCLG